MEAKIQAAFEETGQECPENPTQLKLLNIMRGLGPRIEDKKHRELLIYSGTDPILYHVQNQSGDLLLEIEIIDELIFIRSPITGRREALFAEELTMLDSLDLFADLELSDLKIRVGSVYEYKDDGERCIKWAVHQMPPKTDGPEVIHSYFALRVHRMPFEAKIPTYKSPLVETPKAPKAEIQLPQWTQKILEVADVEPIHEWSISVGPITTQFCIPIRLPEENGRMFVIVNCSPIEPRMHVVGFAQNTMIEVDELCDYFKREIDLLKVISVLTR